jgi:hypothetical protein
MPICRRCMCSAALFFMAGLSTIRNTLPSGPLRRCSRPRNRLVAMSRDGETAGPGRRSRCPPRGRSSGERNFAGARRAGSHRIRDHGARERLDQARLAGAVVADDREDLARVELEVRAVDGGHVAVALDQALGLQDRLAGLFGGHHFAPLRRQLVHGHREDDQDAGDEDLVGRRHAHQDEAVAAARRRSARRSTCR